MGGNAEQAAEYANRALELSPNSAYVQTQSGWALVYSAETERAIECFTMARRLEPLDPRRYTTLTGMAAAHFFARRFDECIRIASRVVEEAPSVTVAWRFLAASYALNGQIGDARRTTAGLLARQPSASVRGLSKTTSYRFEWMRDLLVEGVHLAGLPE
jgi:tetratricopeptide (TPR) repeat protein